MKKRILSVVLIVALVVCTVPFSASAYTGNQYTSNKIVAERLNQLFRAYEPNRTYFTSSYMGNDHSGNKYKRCLRSGYTSGSMAYCGYYDGTVQCHAYARYAQSILFGKTETGRIDGAPGGKNIVYQRVSYPTKAQLMKMPVGTLLYADTPHSAILLDADARGLTVVDCNVNWYCKVSLRTIPWNKIETYSQGLAGRIVRATYPTAATYPKSVPVNIKAYTTTDVNLRSGPGTGYRSLKLLPKNTNLTITDKGNSSWYQVKLSNGTAGYVSSSYLKQGTYKAPAKPTAVPSKGQKMVTTEYVNFRKGPGEGYGVIKTLPVNTAVTVVSSKNKSWYQVKLSNGQTGYVSSKYLKAGSGSASTAKMMTTTAYVNLRTGAGTKYTVLLVVPPKTKVTVVSTANKSWYKVKIPSGKQGYLSRQYLK